MQRLETYKANDTVIAPRNHDLHRRAQISVFRTYLIYIVSAVAPLDTWFYMQDTQITPTVGVVCFLYLLAMSLLARSYGRNITRTLEADAAEKNSESRFRDFAELGADLFWEVDTEMRYPHIFGRYEEIMGKSRTYLVGQSRLEMLYPSDAESYQEHWPPSKSSGGSITTRWFVLFGQPILKIDPIAMARDSVQLLVWQPDDEPLPQPPALESHLEVLVRMLDDDGATIPPGAFLPAAERYDLSPKIDKWVLQATFDWLICDPGRLDKVSCCSVNLSGNSLGEDKFVDFVVGELDRTAIPAHKICFEIT